ncbi:flagellar protein FlgN [Fredinandcohnia quinoae]|uniref:Flagellar protein FlgN n=1 Tax=Fredinandcohnia quinoae TaxID=2918902 RepID=A0AAW5E8H6_9BACI|nr:flagellar protein FlgN [Fredinandcohnia sp. SECRCQ15]MCH1625074.1 flagellar protein FlgN [Fredinandcohnia sp. SECRCQ15]
MSAEKLIQLLNKILILHENLYKLSEQKTENLKKGDIDALSKQMKEEQKYILAIKQLEDQRVLLVQEILNNPPRRNVQLTLSDVIEVSNEPERRQLVKLKEDITKSIAMLRERNHLNQQLTNQSLQFVNMELELFYPTEKTVNYENPNINQSQKKHRSMFDSKA